ncbi:MAG: orotate phosphoribosyltransferase [Clostridia bacterium]|nr:orotate phosphoribosyltransferase [Clostridia bacterium]
MNTQATQVAEALFRTEALKVAPADRPFWYTSGTLGPYFINTHYLFGGEAPAKALLALIDSALTGDHLALPAQIGQACLAHYREDPLYAAVMDYAVELASGLDFDAVSGGERRDFFFSYVLAARCGRPHITLFKDMSAVWTDADFSGARHLAGDDLAGLRVLHVADLVTEASSYIRNWLPALRGLGACVKDSLAVVDRSQGGKEVLAEAGVALYSLIELDEAFFDAARAKGQINPAQEAGILAFREAPRKFMADFFQAHPDFIKGELAAGGKEAERAQRAIELGFATAE